MGTVQWAQKCEQTDIEIFVATIYKIKFLITFITFIKSNMLIVKHKALGKYLKQEKLARNENKIFVTLPPPCTIVSYFQIFCS